MARNITAPVPGLSSEMVTRIYRAFNRTWDIIACDIMNCFDEPRISYRVVAELCMDHLYQYGNDQEAQDAWEALGFDDKIRVAEGAFSDFNYYCL